MGGTSVSTGMAGGSFVLVGSQVVMGTRRGPIVSVPAGGVTDLAPWWRASERVTRGDRLD